MATAASDSSTSSIKATVFRPPSLTSLVQVLGIASILGYAVVLSFYDRFYGALGVRPEDVGMDKTAILSRTAGSLYFLTLIACAAFALILITRLFRIIRLSRKDIAQAIGAELIALAIPIGILTQQVHSLNQQIDLRALQVISGTRVEPIRYFGFTMVDLRGEPAEVDWIGDPDKRPYVIDPKIQRLVYLGQRDGVALLITNESETVRVPASDVIVTFLCVRILERQIPLPRCTGGAERPGPRITIPSPTATPKPTPSRTP